MGVSQIFFGFGNKIMVRGLWLFIIRISTIHLSHVPLPCRYALNVWNSHRVLMSTKHTSSTNSIFKRYRDSNNLKRRTYSIWLLTIFGFLRLNIASKKWPINERQNEVVCMTKALLSCTHLVITARLTPLILDAGTTMVKWDTHLEGLRSHDENHCQSVNAVRSRANNRRVKTFSNSTLWN